MIGKAIGAVLALGAWAATRAAAKMAPRREVDVFAHSLRAKQKPWRHLAVYLESPGWLFIQVDKGTMEVAWKTREELGA